MNAITWELLTQVVVIQITQYQPHYLPGFSDCTSAIALRSYINPLAHTCGRLWASAAHVHATCDRPRRFTHIKAHPKRDLKCKYNPTSKEISIFVSRRLNSPLNKQMAVATQDSAYNSHTHFDRINKI
jgi:hypothetical protein